MENEVVATEEVTNAITDVAETAVTEVTHAVDYQKPSSKGFGKGVFMGTLIGTGMFIAGVGVKKLVAKIRAKKKDKNGDKVIVDGDVVEVVKDSDDDDE